MALTYNDALDGELHKLLAEEIARLQEELANPAAVADFPAFRFRVGEIAGLRRAADLCEIARENVSNR